VTASIRGPSGLHAALSAGRRCHRHVDRIAGRLAALALIGCTLMSDGSIAQTQISQTKHNLTASGPGAVRTTTPAGTCVFCHTPHSANATRALWNRALPGVTYQLYASSTTKATLNQPTGSSRLCLSCHDGILALETLKVPPKGAALTSLGPLTGSSVLGTNLSDNHPISFVYDSALASRRGNLADPLSLPATVRLDESRQLQCTTCHDPHESRRAKFLRVDNGNGLLCTSCHLVANWAGSTHSTSAATWNGIGVSPWLADALPTVAQNACLSCHRPHAAAHAQRLLAQSAESANCSVCHNGAVATKKIDAEFLKPSIHPIESSPWTHDPIEVPGTMVRHVSCSDCHNPHASNAAPGMAPIASGRLRGVTSVTIAGLTIPDPNFEYEVCVKCHGLTEPTTAGITRADATRNIRQRIAPGNASIHPVAGVGVNPTIVGLLPGYTSSSMISCASCHNNDAAPASAAAPAGPHGSLYAPILERPYQTSDPQPYSPASYDLCFKCHDATALMNPTNNFHHNTHVVQNQAPCAACHDAHGSRRNAHLIDFMLRDRNNNPVVAPNATAPLPLYTPLGPGHGRCDLVCHGSGHVARSY
jgi:predicted CXXCH cytochrome family protein